MLGSMLGMWLRLTHDEGIPMPISTMDQVNCLGRALDGTMQLDLEGFPDLGGHNEDVCYQHPSRYRILCHTV